MTKTASHRPTTPQHAEIACTCPHSHRGTGRAPGGRRGREDLALAEAVRLEFQGRTDGQEMKERYAGAFAKVPLPQYTAPKQTIGKIASLAALGQERFNAATTGRSDPVARMAAARLAAA
jgi:hypothetical protein